MTPEQRLDRAERILVRMAQSGRRSRSEFRFKINSLIDAHLRHETSFKAEIREINGILKTVSESHKLTEKALAELSDSHKLTEKALAELSDSHKLTEKALAELSDSHKLTDKALRDFINSHDKRGNGNI